MLHLFNKYQLTKHSISFLSILVCHLIVFLAFYPGICSFDMNAQITQFVEHDFCTSHPLLHTLYLGFFHDLFSSPNEGYAIATVLQLLLVDGAITYALTYSFENISHKYIYAAYVVFFALFPIIPLLAISHTKDIPFAAFALIFFIDTLRIYKSEIGHIPGVFYCRVIINATLMILLRNNAVYALILTILVLLLIILIRALKHNMQTSIIRVTTICIATLIISAISSKALMTVTNATNGSIKEMMSIPAQMMGYIYNNSASEDEKAIIEEYIPYPEDYKYYLSDPMKKDLPFEIWESKCKHFLLDSTVIGLHHPVDSITAILYSIQGFIDPFHCPYSAEHFFLARHDYRGDAVQESKLQWLCDLYSDIFYDTEAFAHTPLVIPFNPGLYVWIVLIASIISIKQAKNIDGMIAYLFPLTYLATLFLGPGAIIRYAV